jgi:hypothetical protein
LFVIIGVPFDEVVMRTARVRLGATLDGCDIAEVLRTARVRDGVVVVVTGVMVDGNVTVVLVLPVLLPLLLIIVGRGGVGRDAADGIVTFPIARCCVVDGAVTAAVLVVVLDVGVVPARAATRGFTATVGEGTPIDDCVGVGVPMTVRPGDAAAADDTVRGAATAAVLPVPAATVPVPATVEAAVTPAVAAPLLTIAPVLTIPRPAPVSLM